METQFGLSQTDINSIAVILQQFKNVNEALIFGSRAKGNYKNGSDIDIAIKGEGIDQSELSEISFILNEETLMPYKFDVINYNATLHPQLRNHIDRLGIRFYTKSKIN